MSVEGSAAQGGEADSSPGERGENHPVNRTELIRRAVVAFLEYVRGAVDILLDDPERIYVRADEAVAQLSEWKAEPEIIDAVARATTDYDPEHEAVVVREDAISFTVSIERRDDCAAVGPVYWAVMKRWRTYRRRPCGSSLTVEAPTAPGEDRARRSLRAPRALEPIRRLRRYRRGSVTLPHEIGPPG